MVNKFRKHGNKGNALWCNECGRMVTVKHNPKHKTTAETMFVIRHTVDFQIWIDEARRAKL